jgi:hypothetical protein
LVLPTSIDTALGAVPRETSGVASGVLQAARMVGGSFGAAILAAIINATYQDRLAQTVPAHAHDLGGSVTTGLDAAAATGSQPLLRAVREAFMSGMDQTLWVSAALVTAGGILALVFRPGTGAAPAASPKTFCTTSQPEHTYQSPTGVGSPVEANVPHERRPSEAREASEALHHESLASVSSPMAAGRPGSVASGSAATSALDQQRVGVGEGPVLTAGWASWPTARRPQGLSKTRRP